MNNKKKINGTTMKIERKYIEQVRSIFKNRGSLRELKYDVDVIREVIIEFLEMNKEFLNGD